jgi:hypothetical protein
VAPGGRKAFFRGSSRAQHGPSASFDVDETGALRNLDAKDSTAPLPDLDVAACVKSQQVHETYDSLAVIGTVVNAAGPSSGSPSCAVIHNAQLIYSLRDSKRAN